MILIHQKVCKFKATALKLHNSLFHTLDLYLSHLKGNNECALTCQATWSMIMQMQDGRKRKKKTSMEKKLPSFHLAIKDLRFLLGPHQ